MQGTLKKITKRTIVIVLALATLLLAVHISYITTRLDRETENTLRKMADYDVLLLQDKITMEMMELQRSAVYFSEINEHDFLDATTAASSIRNFNQTNSGQQTLKLVSASGMSYNFIEEPTPETNIECLQLSINGKACVGDLILQRGNEDVRQIYFSVPINKTGKTVASLVKMVTMNYFSQEIVGDTFHDDGYLVVIKADGSYIFIPEEMKPAFIDTTDNIYNIFQSTKKDITSFKENIALKKSGAFFYELLGENKYIYYQPLGISDWYILSIIPAKQITKTSSEITWATIGFSFLGLALLLISAWYIFSLKEYNRKELYNIAYIDLVTGGSNFNKFREDCQLIFDKHIGKHALVVFDIDKFKIFNDLHGFAIGDIILKHFHNVLAKGLQADELFARLRSDKFVVLMNYTTKELILERLNDIAQKFCDVQFSVIDDASGETLKLIDKENIREALDEENHDKTNDSFNYMFSVSTGIYQIPVDVISLDLMLDRAFIALKNGKETFGSSFAFYEDQQRTNLLREKEIENAMTTALSNKEFMVFLQPKYDVSTLKIIGAEALIRWQRNINGTAQISPGEFIPLFEKNGFIARVDQFVLEEVCKQIVLWRNLGKHVVVPCSVNMSRTQLYNKNFIEMFKQTVLKYKLSPSDIEIEITEGIVFDDAKLLIEIINDIRNFGFSIAIDDFGAGYSSLNLIKDIPADTLKLDQKFFDNFEENPRAHLVVETIVKMAKQLDMKVVAEGIETEAQLNFLRHVSCDYAQGFFLARPISMDDFAELLIKTNS